MVLFEVICTFAICCSAIYWIVTLACTLSFFRRKPATAVAFHPPVSILKPLCGLDEDLEQNLRSWCGQDYPDYQILFGVEAESDPCVSIVRKILCEFPHRNPKLIICGSSQSANRKVHQLRKLAAEAIHKIFILADSDVGIEADGLRRIMLPLADKSVGLVCCPYRWISPLTVPSALEALTSCAEFIPSVLLVERFGKLDFSLGATLAVRRECIDGIGGFESIQDYLADDYQLGKRLHRLGFRLVLSDYIVDLTTHRTTWEKMRLREIRLGRTYRACSPVGFFLSILTHGVTWATILLWCMHGSPLGWSIWLGTLTFRLLSVLVLQLTCFPDQKTTRYLWLLPLRDWLASLWWLLAFTGSKISWRGHHFVLKSDGTLKPL